MQTNMEVMVHLRQAIEEEHKKTEQLPFYQALLTERLPFSLYIEHLKIYWAIHQTLEKQYRAHSPLIQAIWREEMIKTSWLEEDLTYFAQTHELSPLVQQVMLAFLHAIENEMPMKLLGILYTLEGSTLGNRVLLPHLKIAYSLDRQGMRYYEGYGERTLSHWQHFKARMNANLSTDPQTVIEGALQTFHMIQTLLIALWPSKEPLTQF